MFTSNISVRPTIVKMTQEEHEAAKKNKPDYVSVTLVDNKKIKWPGVIRKSGDSMVVINPYYEMEQYGHPGFVKLSEYELAKQTELR